MPLTGSGIDTFVADTRRCHLHSPGGGQHLAGLMIAVAHHQTMTIRVTLIGELLDIRSNLGPQRRGQHLPRPVSHDFIYQRPTSTVGGVAGFIIVVNYGKHGRTFPTSAPTPVLIRPTGFSDHPREGAPTITRPRRGSSTSSDHCSCRGAIGTLFRGRAEDPPIDRA
jgi:hypothetical protein